MALRGDRTIPKARCAEIMQVAREMGYHPNPMAVGLAVFKRSSKTIPVRAVLAWINFWPEPKELRKFTEFELYWQGANSEAEKMGYRLEEFVCHDRLTAERLEQILLARGIYGIMIPPHPLQPDWGSFNWERFSALRLGRSMMTPRTHVVTSDHVANAMTAVDAIRLHGYKRIGFVGDTAVTDRRWLFEAGFLRAQLEISQRDRLRIFAVDRLNPYASQTELTTWLKKHKPDAVLSSFPQLPDMVQKSGYRIPEDIGMAATSILDGNLDAGIHQNSEEIGRVATLMLISLIHDNARGIPLIHRELLVKGKWIDGSSLPPRHH